MSRLRGLVALVRDAVEAGSVRIEALQKETLERPIAILRAVPGLDVPASFVHSVITLSLSGTHQAIRGVNRVAATVLERVLPER